MLELKKTAVTFHKGSQLETSIFRDLSLEIPQKQFVTLIGGNGAGKSTLLNMIAGEIKPDEGVILLDSQDITSLSTEKRSSGVTRVFQDPALGTFAALTIEENLSLAHKRGQSRKFVRSLNRVLRQEFQEKLALLKMGLEKRLEDKVSSLSGGQRQALSLVMATLQNAKLLLLDEHTAALDPKTARVIMDLTDTLVKKHQLTTLMVTHNMSQALTHGNRTLMMYHGKIVKDMEGKERNSLSPDDLTTYFDLI